MRGTGGSMQRKKQNAGISTTCRGTIWVSHLLPSPPPAFISLGVPDISSCCGFASFWLCYAFVVLPSDLVACPGIDVDLVIPASCLLERLC